MKLLTSRGLRPDIVDEDDLLDVNDIEDSDLDFSKNVQVFGREMHDIG